MPLRTFEHFPNDKECPLCGKNTDSECFLASIDGTQEDNICEAIPIHTGCLDLNWSDNLHLLYQYRVRQ